MLLQPIRLCLYTFVRAHISKTARSLLNVTLSFYGCVRLWNGAPLAAL